MGWLYGFGYLYLIEDFNNSFILQFKAKLVVK